MDTVTSTASTMLAGGSTASNITTGPHMTLPKEQLYPLVAMLALFSVTGTIGNAIAFYVFSTLKKQVNIQTPFIMFV
jgi:hypothetical protein